MTTDIVLPSGNGRTGQATAIEQSRAVAEVLAAIQVAQQFPRDQQRALRQMRDSCQMQALADRAFFRFPRGKETVSGPSIHLARELARCWGNIQYGVAEMRRDDGYAQSEMLAWAWDVETNTRSTTIFIVPHKRDKKDRASGRPAPEPLIEMRDIYENNANNGARRVRECIFAVLPPWLVEEAKERCHATLKDGGGKPVAQRIAEMITGFRGLGVSEEDLVRKLGRKSAHWDPQDLAQMGVVFGSLQRGEISRDEEFPQPAVTGAEIAAHAAVATVKPETPPAADGENAASPEVTETKRPAPAMVRKLQALRSEVGLAGDDVRHLWLDFLTTAASRPIKSSNELTAYEAASAISVMEQFKKQQPGRRLRLVGDGIAELGVQVEPTS